MVKGYAGKVLEIDLTEKEIGTKKFSDEDLNKFIGGTGLASKVLLENVKPELYPLSKENCLIFMTGPFTATKIPTSGRHAVVFKSPLTGTWGEADVGGSFGYSLKKAGYDGIIIKGMSEKQAYLLVDESYVVVEDAEFLRGKDAYETDEKLKEKHGSASVACIGPAGESMTKFASIMHDGRHGRAAGRGGSGAVMGSKNLKAIVVKPGHNKIEVAKPKELNEIIISFSKSLIEKTKRLNLYGTDGAIEGFEAIADVPIKNWVGDNFDVEKISGPHMAEIMLTGKYGCKSCIIRCGREVKVEKYGVEGAGPEYETVAAFGPNCLINDLEAIAYANELCNRAGLDTITTGSLVAYCMEAFEKGLIKKEDLGFELKWGDAEAMIKLIKKIIKKDDLISCMLGEGIKKFSVHIGGEDFAVHVKGLDFPEHDPRASMNDFSYGNTNFLAYATSFRGACHLQGFSHTVDLKGIPFPELGLKAGELTNKERAVTVAKMQDYSALYDSLKFCKFTMFGDVKPRTVLALYNAVTGNDLNLEEFMKVGERICNMKHLFNLKDDFTKDDDKLPERILTIARRDGSPKDFKKNFKKMLDHYYKYRGWNSEKNLRKKLRSLKILDYY